MGTEKNMDLEVGISSQKNESIARVADIEPVPWVHEIAEDDGRAAKSEPLFSMYLERANEDDNIVIERWRKEADTILIFAGLFSVALAVLLAVSIQDLRPKPQDGSAFYLANIYRVLANSTTSQPVVLPTPADPPVFSPPGYAVWVNTLWSLSLVISFSTAILVIFVQQWAHSYLRATQEGYTSRTRAQVHAFYNKGLNTFHFATVVTLAPLLIHASLALFFAGFSVWLININHTVGLPVISWFGLCILGYAFVTLQPIVRHDSPYYSPLSSFIWLFIARVRYTISRLFPSPNLRQLPFSLRTTRLRSALALSQDFIYHSLLWTFESLQRDDELELFYDAIPNLCASNDESLENFIIPHQVILTEGLIGLMDRTFSSSLVSEPVRFRRIIICTEALRATGQHLLGSWYFLHRVLLREWQGFLESVSVGLLVQSWKDIAHPTTMFYAQCVVSAIIATAPVHDDPWIQLVIRHLAVSESTLQDYLENGQSVLLANLNHLVLRITQLDIGSVGEERNRPILESLKVLESMRKFDVRRTSPELQYQFCDLWNQLIDRARNDKPAGTRAISVRTLKQISKVYIALHAGTDAVPLASYSGDSDLDDVTSYPTCTIDEHHPIQTVSMSHLSEAASGTENTSRFATIPTFPGPSSAIPQVTPLFPIPSPQPSRAIEATSDTGNKSKHPPIPTITSPTTSLPIPFIPSVTASHASEAAPDTGGNVSSLITIPALHPSLGPVAPQAPDQAHANVDPLSSVIQAHLQMLNVDPLSHVIQSHLHEPDETHSGM